MLGGLTEPVTGRSNPASGGLLIAVHNKGPNSWKSSSILLFLVSATLVRSFSDDFDDNSYTSHGWVATGGVWTLANGFVTGTENGSTDVLRYTPPAPEPLDPNPEIWFSYMAANTSGTAGAYVRRVDANNNVFLELTTTTIRVYQTAAGVLTLKGSANVTSAVNTWYDIYVKLEGANIEVSRNVKNGILRKLTPLTVSTLTVLTSTNFQFVNNGAAKYSFDTVMWDGRNWDTFLHLTVNSGKCLDKGLSFPAVDPITQIQVPAVFRDFDDTVGPLFGPLAAEEDPLLRDIGADEFQSPAGATFWWQGL